MQITIGGYVPSSRRTGYVTSPICPTPPGRVSPGSSCRSIHTAAGPCPPERWREYLDAILYVLRTGCAWRHLPHDFTVGWSSAHKHFLRWCRTGTWTKVLTAVRGEARTRTGRRRRPSAAVVASPAQAGGAPTSVEASPVAGPRGFDGAKKVDGVKRRILVDSTGMLVTAADVQDRAAFP